MLMINGIFFAFKKRYPTLNGNDCVVLYAFHARFSLSAVSRIVFFIPRVFEFRMKENLKNREGSSPTENLLVDPGYENR